MVLLAAAVLLRRPIILLGGVRGEGSARSVLPLLDARWGMTSSPLLGFDSGSSVSMPARVDASAGLLALRSRAGNRSSCSPLFSTDDGRRARGGGVPSEERLYRSPALVLRRLRWAAEVGGFCFKAAELARGWMDVWWLDQARSSFDDGGRRRRAEVQELRSLGRSPGRCAIADGSIPSFGTGVHCDSPQSRQAMEFLQLMGLLGVLLDGGGRRRSSRAALFSQGPRDLVVIFLYLRVLCDVWVTQLSLYPSSVFLYLYAYVYVFLT